MNLQMGDLLGKGGYGSVRMAKLNDKPIAVKSVLNFQIWNEIKILKMLPKNPYIVNSIGIHEYKDDAHVYILMELCEMSLHQQIQLNDGITDQQLMNLIKCFINGFGFLHRHDIVHGDIKPANLLVLNNNYKFADFGLSIIAKPNTRLKMAGCSFSYSHLLVFKMNNWSRIGIEDPKESLPWAIVLYSVGVTIYEAISAKKPFRATSHRTMYNLLMEKKHHIRGTEVNGQYFYFDMLPPCSIQNKSLMEPLRRLIQDLLAHDEQKMISFQQFYQSCQNLLQISATT